MVLEELRLPAAISVYELSSRGALSRYLLTRYGKVTRSEYYDDVTPGEFKNGVQCQDVQRLTYPDESFDLVTSTEVFEHVADDLAGFREVHRVLRPAGHFVLTVPLLDIPRTIERTRTEGRTVVHILPPEYHSDRLRGRGKVLAFRNYGLDITDRLESVGFKADIKVINSARNAVAGAKVVCAKKHPRAPWRGSNHEP